MILVLLIPAGLWADEYYQADPARFAQLQAERCARLNREADLIKKRLSRPINYPADIKKMNAKLQVLATSRAKYCAPAESASTVAETTR